MCLSKDAAMEQPIFLDNQDLGHDTVVLRAYAPLPGLGVLPVNAFVIRAAQPVLIDTGLAALRGDFMAGLERAVDPAELRWIWLSHADADHMGNLAAVLEAAPGARVVTTYLGMGKLGLHGLPPERCYLLNPGQSLDVVDRELLAVTPPSYDAPETTGLWDGRSGFLFSADCFGALMDGPRENAGEIPAGRLRDGLVTWATVDAPWLALTEAGRFGESAGTLRALQPRAVLSSHLPPAFGMLDTLLGHLDAARHAPAFVGPDQAALEQMFAAA
jgi:glyoxylase-like metal-dependent hydrolase (beta-lactamase superfamily II)